MSLLAGLNGMPHPDDKSATEAWKWNHYNDHVQIVQAINNQTGKNLTVYPLNQVPDHDEWMVLHAAFHSDMARQHGSSYTDLSDLDPHDDSARADWSHRNYNEHLVVRNFLAGVPI